MFSKTSALLCANVYLRVFLVIPVVTSVVQQSDQTYLNSNSTGLFFRQETALSVHHDPRVGGKLTSNNEDVVQDITQQDGNYHQNFGSKKGKVNEYIATDKQTPQTSPNGSMRDLSITDILTQHTGHDTLDSKAMRNYDETSKTLIQRLCKVHGKYSVCYQHGDSVCRCAGNLADCSGTPGFPNMTYAPKLPPNINCLIFTNNEVQSLQESYFSNVSNFIVIDFSMNNLKTVSARTFEKLTSLQYLILNKNVLTYSQITRVIDYVPSLRLDLIQLGLREIPRDFFNRSALKLSQLYMDFNRLDHVNLSDFSGLASLQYLSLTNSSIKTIVPGFLKKVKVIDLKNNQITTFLNTCKVSTNHPKKDNLNTETIEEEAKKQSYFPILGELYIDTNSISSLPPADQLCLPELSVLVLDQNNITEIPNHAFAALTTVRRISFTKQQSNVTRIGDSAFGLPKLTTLYLSRNNIEFGSPDVSMKLFEGATSLLDMTLDHNRLENSTDNNLVEMFKHLPSLRYLYLSYCGMTSIPVESFSQLANLKSLFLYSNNIKEIPDKAFDKLKHLETLYIDHNELTCIREASFSVNMTKQLRFVDFSKNDFLCNCDLLWFQTWLKNPGGTEFKNPSLYECSDQPNVLVQEYKVSVQACLFSRTTYILFVVCVSILIVVFVVFAIFYRYRWTIRLMMYERKVARGGIRHEEEDGCYEYDIFIVYCNDDCDWVENVLLPVVEKKWKLKACIHQRDFKAGYFIIDNIIEAMNNSRRILVVLSSGFSHSSWCKSELMLCQSHIITHNLPSLKVIQLEPIDMLALYKTVCYLEWPVIHGNDQEEITKFWSRLHYLLKDLIEQKEQTSVMRM
ncbi:toll-like receptor 3 [Physella acuta]|uniref:toll-like receptor 3 n=1 Tax=Physella acuta TaxID=109671 RepID=UPI0027DE8B9E|nr:toll-like receptor 3 [Physella acuta]